MAMGAPVKSVIHFISGLPRSGSTLLATILAQNPAFYSGVESPLADVLLGALRTLSQHEAAVFVTDRQREQVVRSIIGAYYGELVDRQIIFDSNRVWCSLLPLIAMAQPVARVFCCVRNPAWILDSLERQVHRHPTWIARAFEDDRHSTVYSRTARWSKGTLGTSLSAFRQAWYGDDASRLIVIPYDSLCARPAETITALYNHLGWEPFDHDFEHLSYEAQTFDRILGLPNMHRVLGPVLAAKRETVLPPDLFTSYNEQFWLDPSANPRQVTVI